MTSVWPLVPKFHPGGGPCLLGRELVDDFGRTLLEILSKAHVNLFHLNMSKAANHTVKKWWLPRININPNSEAWWVLYPQKKMMPTKIRYDESGLFEGWSIPGWYEGWLIHGYRTFETFENKIHQNSKGCLCSLCKFRTCWDCLKIAKHLCRLSPFFKNLNFHNKFAPWVETSPFHKKTKQPAYLWFADLKDLQCCLAGFLRNWLVWLVVDPCCSSENRPWYRGVSKNRGTPKWMVYNGKPY